ncbi:hypothetical protein QUA03_18650 [Microcoleus sp. S36b_A4]
MRRKKKEETLLYAQTLSVECASSQKDLPKIECYVGKLNQIFMNLLSNAIHALNCYDQKRTSEQIKNDHGTITICTSMLN